MWYFAVLAVTICFLTDSGFSAVNTSQHLKFKELFNNYEKQLKPTINVTSVVNISFQLNAYHLMDVSLTNVVTVGTEKNSCPSENEREQYVELHAWLVETWQDELLYWDNTTDGFYEELIIDSKYVWTPDTRLFNSLVMNDEDLRPVNLNVQITARSENGRNYSVVKWIQPVILKFTCFMTALRFPFDSQTCEMSFGSWSFAMNDLDYYTLDGPAGGKEHFKDHEEWQVVGDIVGVRKTHKYQCCPHPFVTLEYTLILRRKPLYYIVNLIIPICIISMIALAGFFLPGSTNGERTEKVTLGVTTLLSMSLLGLMVADRMPTTSDAVPLISLCYLCLMVLIAFGAVSASLVISISKRGRKIPPTPLPASLRVACLFVSKALFVTIPDHILEDEEKRKLSKSHSYNAPEVAVRKVRLSQVSEEDSDPESPSCEADQSPGRGARFPSVVSSFRRSFRNGATKVKSPDPDEAPSAHGMVGLALGQHTKRLLSVDLAAAEVRDFRNRLLNRDVVALCVQEWEWFAATIERFMLFFFLLACCLLGVWMLVTKYTGDPHYNR